MFSLVVDDGTHARIEGIRSHVREHDLTAWIAAQLGDLDRVASARPG